MSKLLEIAETMFPQLLKYVENLPKTSMRYYWINEFDSNNLSPFERLCFNHRLFAIADNEIQGQFILRMIDNTVTYNVASEFRPTFDEERIMYIMDRILSDECLVANEEENADTEYIQEQLQKIVEFITTDSTSNEYESCPISEVPKTTGCFMSDIMVGDHFYTKKDCEYIADLSKADIWNWRRLKDHLYENGYAPENGASVDMRDIKNRNDEWRRQANAEADEKNKSSSLAVESIVKTITKGVGKDVVSALTFRIVGITDTMYTLQPIEKPNAKTRNVPKERVVMVDTETDEEL